ncbi:MAG: NAD-dependent succinate-semialdehyde dehydrogenase [Nanoarchaeota archaeon]|nr:NAD-dependent succinate-semialdehyde dehydrogenase [Nanoarchaeota archaeon]
MSFETINPATEEVIDSYENMPADEVMRHVACANKAQKEWAKVSVKDRAAYFVKLARVLRKNTKKYADLMTLEMGKCTTQAQAEVEKCAWSAEVYAENAEKWLAEEKVKADGLEHFVRYEAMGVIMAIMPWNFPFWQALRFGIPTLLAGNGGVLKHSNQVPQCAVAIEEAFAEAGFPKGLFKTVITGHEAVAEAIASPLIAGVSLTGSTGAGRHIAEAAGRAIKPCVLELGGSDPFIVLEDADIAKAAKAAAGGRFLNGGQSCIASKRFLVHKDVAEEFSAAFVAEVSKIVVGDPTDAATNMGPLVNKDAYDDMLKLIKDAVAKGGKILTGGKNPFDKGYFIEPTVIANANGEMRIMSEEVFGPIAPIYVFSSEDEAIALANNSEFGLGGSVFTKDLERGKKVASQIESGAVFVNNFTKSDPRMPFGGIKTSGIGRELSHYGLKEFVNVKGYSIYE